MTTLSDGGPAHPAIEHIGGDPSAVRRHHGMSLRDWFAGQALAGMYAHGYFDPKQIARDAYDAADAMIAARSTPDSAVSP